VRVGLVASDADLGRHFAAHDREVALQVVEAYAARAATLAKDGAQVVVLPEKFVGLTPEYADTAHAILATVAREHGVTIVAGFNLLDPTERRNVAIAFSPAGDEALVYDKEHLVPGLEARYRRGGTIGLLPGTAPITGVAICKDLDFLPLGRAYSRAGAGLLLVPAWDFIKDAWLHSRMAVLRGVEGGFAVARCADEGRLTVSDARGRILGERSTREAPEVFLAASVPTGAGRTIYSRTGDWFAWLCGTIVAACSVAAMRNRRRVVGPGA
jgi:apolipoprotein N-acyltransferase